MIIRYAILLFSLILLTLGCSPKFRIGSDSAPGLDLTKYQTFRKDPKNLFTKRSNSILNSELTKKRIDYSISKDLQGKGYQLDDQNPDLIFSYQTEIRQRQSVSQSNPNMGVNPWGPWGYNAWAWNNPMMFPSPSQTTVRDYEETTLIIDFRDTKTGELVWQGWIVGELRYNDDNFAQRLESAVKQAMSKFPAKNNGR